MIAEYDPAKDSIGSYYAAIAAKRARGDHLKPQIEPDVKADHRASGRARLDRSDSGANILMKHTGIRA